MAADARWLADDLATATAQRPALVRTELEARALMMRRALDLGETALAQSAAHLIDRRARSEQGTPGLPPELLWDHRVDARVGSFIAAGAALERGEEGVGEHEYEQRRREAMIAVDQAPAGHDGRARYWAAYLDDRHAEMLAACGQEARALRVARRARDGWEHLGSTEDVADRKSTRLNSSHVAISYAVFCLKKKSVRATPLSRYRSSPSTSRTNIPSISPWSIPQPAASRLTTAGRTGCAGFRWPACTSPASC